MNSLRFAIIISILVMACQPASQVAQRYELPVSSPETVGISTTAIQQIDSLMHAFVDSNQVPCVGAMIIRNGKVAFNQNTGMIDAGRQQPLASDHIYRIASMTKPVTAVAALMLIEEGQLGLDDPVANFIPEFGQTQVMVNYQKEDSTFDLEAPKQAITIRHLLTHTSGIGYAFIQEQARINYLKAGVIDGLSLEKDTLVTNVQKLASCPLLHHPGEGWTYGLSIDVLGRVVEVVSGQNLSDFMESRIFEPLGMDDTHFYLPPEKADRLLPVIGKNADGQFATAAELDPVLGPLADFPIRGAQSMHSGGGGLCSTTENFARFALMLNNGGALNGVRILSEETVKMMGSNHLDPAIFGDYQFGLGVSVRPAEAYASHPDKVGGFGWGGYFKTRYWSDPSEDLVAVLMCQMVPNEVPDKLFDQVAGALYKGIIREAKPVEASN